MSEFFDRLHLRYGFGDGFLELTITVPISPQDKERLKLVIANAIDLAIESFPSKPTGEKQNEPSE